MNQPIVFMFSGQGSQYFQMGKELYDNHPRFKMWMDHCDEIVEPLIDGSLMDVIYEQDKCKTEPFDRLLHTNPALLCIEYSLAKVLMEMGIKPDYLLGYSLGEFVAAVINGAVSLEESFELLVGYAELLESQSPSAGMLAVLESTQIIAQYPQLFERCHLTGENFDRNFVISGLSHDIDQLQKALKDKAIICQRLPVNFGFHTEILEPIKPQFQQLVDYVDVYPIEMPTISALKLGQLEQIDDDYFWQVSRQPVNFAKTINVMLQQQDCIFIDVGPSGTLATFVKYNLPANSKSRYFEVMNQFGHNLKSLEHLKQQLENQ